MARKLNPDKETERLTIRIDKRVLKMLKRMAIDSETTLMSLVSEGLSTWIYQLRQAEIDVLPDLDETSLQKLKSDRKEARVLLNNIRFNRKLAIRKRSNPSTYAKNEIDELVFLYDNEILRIDGFDNCVIGICVRAEQEPVLCYSEEMIISQLVTDGMTKEEAVEFFESNQLDTWVGEGTPCFLTHAL